MTPPDLIVALRAFLLANTGVAGQVAARIYGDELPQSLTASMPTKAILLRHAGGYNLNFGYMLLADPRVDVFCYGKTPYDAGQVYQAAHGALRQMTRNVQGQAMLHWAKPSGGPISTRQEDTEWPLIMSSWQLLGSEMEVA